MYYVYILACGDGSLYTGIAANVQQRLLTHQSGKGAKYTRSHLPVTLVYTEPQPDRSSALRREYAIKQLTHQQKLQLIQQSTDRKKCSAASITGNCGALFMFQRDQPSI